MPALGPEALVPATRAALPALLEHGGGVVHVASEAAHLPDPPIVDYAAAKAALLSLSKALATEFGSRGVRSNVVSPDPTRTRLWDDLAHPERVKGGETAATPRIR